MTVKYKKFFIMSIVLIAAAVFVFSYFFILPWQARHYLNNTSIGKWLEPSRIALKKASNIVHLPYWFKKSNLPAYYITTSKDDITRLTASIPFDAATFSYGYLLDDDKQYVKVDFSSPSDNYEAKVKLRYRGWSANNWNAEQKALRIKFPKDNLFSGMSALNFFLPDDRSYFGEMLNSYRARKFGLLPVDFKLVRVFINGKDSGVYLASEPWSKEFLARNNIYDTDNIFSNKDVQLGAGESFFSTKHLADWKSYTTKPGTGPFEELDVLINLVENANDSEFAAKIGSILDLDKFYHWQFLYALAGTNHAGDTGNTVLLFRTETGKFESLPWDVELGPFAPDYYASVPTLSKRILANKKFLTEYQKVVNDYISNETNLQDDLAYYDNLDKKYHFEFYKDQAKLDTDLVFDQKIKDYRSLIVDNFKNLGQITTVLSVADFKSGKSNYNLSESKFNGTFEYFNDIFLSQDQFLANHPQFKKIDGFSIVLPAGVHVFDGVTIVPKGLKLVIEPGAQLLFSPNASLIAYSAVSAVGTADSPILMQPLKPEEATPWGVFGAINTGASKNYFNFVHINGGSSATVNGILFTSQLSLSNTLSLITNSTFENSKSDDGLHGLLGSVDIIGSVFKNVSSDGIDFDYVKNSKISGSVFYNDNREKSGLDGDGIDISGTANVVVENNKISNFGDKCISIGENAQIEIRNNILVGCNYGVAVKDNSDALIDGNVIVGNKTAGVALYRKKPEFIVGGRADVLNSIIWGNNKEISVDQTTSVANKSGVGTHEILANKTSVLVVKNSTVKGGYESGENIITSKPDFRAVLPAYIFKLSEKILQN